MPFNAAPSRDLVAGSGTAAPSNAQGRTGLGALWDWATSLLGITGDPADARAALSVYSKSEIDSLINQDYKASVRVATTAAINLAAPGSTIDGVAMVAGDRFLDKDNATGNLRGIYIWNGAAVPATRAMDADGVGELTSGAIVAVEEGTVNADSQWMLATDEPITIGTTALTFVKKGANGSSASGLFYKPDPASVVFTKTSASTISIKAGAIIDVAGTAVTFAAATAITMPSLVAGSDYSVWVKDDGTIQAVVDPYSAPASAPGAGNWRKIGGFHYGLVAPATTVAGGSFATAGNGMIWTQTDVDRIAGINEFSLWDLHWTVKSIDMQPRGMAFDPQARCWVGLYFVSTNHIANGPSAYNTDVASGTVLPRRPVVYGGNGTATYGNGNWWTFNEVLASFGLRFGFEREFVSAAFGVTENQSLGGASSTIPATARQAGYTSRIGCEQMSGHHYTWGMDTGHYGESFSWQNINDGRGQVYTSTNTKVILGGGRGSAAYSGSRASSWSHYPWFSAWLIGARAFGDHLVLF